MASSFSAGAASIPSDSPSFARRLMGVVRRPSVLLAQAVVRPRWLDILAFSTGVAVAAALAFGLTPTGRTALLDQWEGSAYLLGHELSEAEYAQARHWAHYAGLYTGVMTLLTVAGATIAVAAAAYAATRRSPARPHFRPLLAVSAHASWILAIRQLVATPVGLLRETASSSLSVGSWFPGLEASSPLARTLGLLDVFVIWWAIVLGIGFAIASGARPKRVAASLIGTYAALALLASLVVSLTGHDA